MVKKQKDKQYQTAREHRATQQERSGSSNIAGSGSNGVVQRRLPFTHCALTLVPFETPVCNAQGILFDNAAVVAFVLSHKMDPVTGEAADTSSLIRLHMDRNEEGAWQCPILTKPFTDHSKVVAILQPPSSSSPSATNQSFGKNREANVYSHEAFQELNVKAKNFTDLTTGAKFDRHKDVLILFDPNDDELNRRRDINSFYHVQHARELEKTRNGTSAVSSSNVRHNVATARVMEKLQQKQQEQRQEEIKAELQRQKKRKQHEESIQQLEHSSGKTVVDVTRYIDSNGKPLVVLAEDVTGVRYTERHTATSLTSTAVAVAHDNVGRRATVDEIIAAQSLVLRRLRKKAYVRLRIRHTGRGGTIQEYALTIELHCDMVPQTCLNFLGLCRNGQYDNSQFHRLVPKFMIQGGGGKSPPKPTGADISSNNQQRPDECLWGGSFADEMDDRLKHVGPGVVSMANAGAHTNTRQFFITFGTCAHLDGKHSVFGTVVDGLDAVLDKWQSVAVDKKERPKEEICIVGTDVLVDPSLEAYEMERARLIKLVASREQKTSSGTKPAAAAALTTAQAVKTNSPAVGKYLKLNEASSTSSHFGSGSDTTRLHEGTVEAQLLPRPSKQAKRKPVVAKSTYGDFSGW